MGDVWDVGDAKMIAMKIFIIISIYRVCVLTPTTSQKPPFNCFSIK